jgi:hypothetical protein
VCGGGVGWGDGSDGTDGRMVGSPEEESTQPAGQRDKSFGAP